jgi:hypothetical protein
MSKIALEGNASGTGTFTLASPNSSTDRTLDLPDASGVIDRLNRAGNVLQVVSTTKTDTFSATGTNFVDITGLSASITPTSASSKILVQYYVSFGQSDPNANRGGGFRVTRNGTAVGIPNADGSRSRLGSYAISPLNYEGAGMTSQNFLDSPASTSALTYQVQLLFSSGGSFTGYINRSGRYQNTTENNQGPYTSGITLMEIAA